MVRTQPSPPLPDVVREITTDALRRLEERLPGLVTGLYLHGSLGFGEFFDSSDIDFAATASRRPDVADVATLRAVHAELAAVHPGTNFDGFYVLASDLASPPGSCPAVPGTSAGLFSVSNHPDIILATWHELARHGITDFGPDLSTLDIHTDDTALRAYTLEHLSTYWRGQVESMAVHPQESAVPDATAWGVLGTARLRYRLETGEMASKSTAGRHAIEHLDPRWRPNLEEALAIREGRGSTANYADDPQRRRQDTMAFMSAVIHEADPALL
jgi:hypothetical protein